jgi:hypothetical protein
VSRSFLVALPAGAAGTALPAAGGPTGEIDFDTYAALQESQGSGSGAGTESQRSLLWDALDPAHDPDAGHEPYAALRARFGVDVSSDDPPEWALMDEDADEDGDADGEEGPGSALGTPGSSPAKSPSRAERVRGKGKGKAKGNSQDRIMDTDTAKPARAKGKSKALVSAPAPRLAPGMMNDLQSITQLRSKGSSRRFADDVGYLFEGLAPAAALGVRRARCACPGRARRRPALMCETARSRSWAGSATRSLRARRRRRTFCSASGTTCAPPARATGTRSGGQPSRHHRLMSNADFGHTPGRILLARRAGRGRHCAARGQRRRRRDALQAPPRAEPREGRARAPRRGRGRRAAKARRDHTRGEAAGTALTISLRACADHRAAPHGSEPHPGEVRSELHPRRGRVLLPSCNTSPDPQPRSGSRPASSACSQRSRPGCCPRPRSWR